MKGIILKKNEELYVLVGEVVIINAENSKYEVTVQYDEYNSDNKITALVYTTIVFQNQSQQDGSEKKPIEWANMAQRMNMKVGSVICTIVRFSDSQHVRANGYTCRYNGIITIAPDEKHQYERNVIGGMVTWMADKVDSKGNKYISMGLYMGKDRDGVMQNTIINVRDEKLIRSCLKVLSPRENGTKMNAWFRCGEMWPFTNNDLEECSLYTAQDFVCTGSYQKK